MLEGSSRLWLRVPVAMRSHMPGAGGTAPWAADNSSQPRLECSSPGASPQTFGCSIFPSSTATAARRAGAALQWEERGDVTCPLLFIQLNQLLSTPAGLEWREMAR